MITIDRRTSYGARGALLLLAAGLALMAAACRPELPGASIETGAVAVDPAATAVVTDRPQGLTLDVRSAAGLTNTQQAMVVRFLDAYRARGRDSGPVTLAVSTGGPLEPAAVEAASDIRRIAHHLGIDDGRLRIVPGPPAGRSARLHLSYRAVELVLPECGYFPTNLARDPENEPHANRGCAVERNAAVMLARPSDMLGPRGMSPRASERRDQAWDKYVKGQSTVSQKQEAERLKE